MKILQSKKIKLLTLLLAATFVVFFVCVDQSRAETIGTGPFISVAPHTFDISVERGEKVKDKIKIFNRGEFAVPFKVRVIDFDAIDETGEMEIAEGVESENSAVSWFEFENENFIIDPQEKKNIEFTINVPRDAKEQGFYASVMLEADISTILFNESKLQVIPHLGVVFMIKVGQADLTSDLEILEYSVVAEDRLERAEKVVNFFTSPLDSESKDVDVTDTQAPEFLVKLKNNSPYHHKLEGIIKLSGVGWNMENELDFSEVTILPGKIRDILVKGTSDEKNTSDDGDDKISQNEGFGMLQADLNLKTTEGIQKEQQRWVLVYSWKMWVIVFLLGGGLILLTKISKRKILNLRKARKKKMYKKLIWKKELKKSKKSQKVDKVDTNTDK